jgi:low temperature requirement protein LtrA
VGLFTIIVLGESFIKVVTSALGEEHHPFGLYGAFGMVVVACLWWVYFDHANSSAVREAPLARYTWFFAHLLLAIGITAVGVTMNKTVLIEPVPAPVSRRWLVIGRVLGAAMPMGVGALGENRIRRGR